MMDRNKTKTYNYLQKAHDFLQDLCGEQYVRYCREDDPYGRDETMGLYYPFDLLVKPGTSEEVAAILAYCNDHAIPVTPRGGGSGVSGGALPVKKGLLVSLERLNKMLDVNLANRTITVESGVITAAIESALAGTGFAYPIMPGSKEYSFIGGNVAENAGSPYSFKYGSVKDYVLNLQVALPDGTLLWTGAGVSKNADRKSVV